MELTDDQERALNLLVNATANVMQLKASDMDAILKHVEENGTNHKYGTKIDRAVEDALTVILDQME